MTRGSRCAAVVLAVTAAALALVALCAPAACRGVELVRRGDLAAAGLDDLLVPTCATACLTVTAWCWLVAVATVAEVARAPHEPAAPGGGAVRRAVLVACGTTLAGLAVAPAHATPPGDPTVAVTARVEAPHRIDGLPLPDRPTGGPGHREADGPEPARPVVLVRPGDSLWSVATDTAPRGSDVAAWWGRLVDLNRHAVGPDPDLLLPGQRLSLPDPDPHHRPPTSERTDR